MDLLGFPASSVLKNLPASAGNTGLIPGLRRSPGEGNGNPLQFSCLRNPMHRGAWWATVRGVTKSQTRLSNSNNLDLLLVETLDNICKIPTGESGTEYVCIRQHLAVIMSFSCW